MERMCTCSVFQVAGAETENAREKKLLVMPNRLSRRFVLEEHKGQDGRQHQLRTLPTLLSIASMGK